MKQIGAIVDFMSRHPESLASRVIRRETVGPELELDEAPAAVQESLTAADAATVERYYYLIK